MHRKTLLAFALLVASRALAQGAGPQPLPVAGDSAIAAAANTRGLDYINRSVYDSALTEFGTALAIRRALDDSAGLGRTLNSIGATHYQLGQFEAALDHFLEALPLRRAEGDQQGIARILVNIGKTYHDWRLYDRALRVLREARAVADSSGHPFVIGYALNALGDVESEVGGHAAARGLFDASIRAYSTHDPRMTPTDSITGWLLNTASLGRLLVREGRPREALPLLSELARVTLEREATQRAEARAQLYLAEAYRAVGDRVRALRAANRSLEISRRLNQRVFALAALSEISALEEQLGNARGALVSLRAHQALRDTIFSQSTAQRIAAMEAREETERLQRERAAQDELIARQRAMAIVGSVVLVLAGLLVVGLYVFNRRLRERRRELAVANAELATANTELRTALSEVRTLKGLIPICANCKRIRDDQGFWEAVETYVEDRSHAMFSHGICTSCGPELYGEAWTRGSEPPR